VRRWCAPLLDLPPATSALDDYVARRREIGTSDVTRRLLNSAGMSDLLVDTGFQADRLLDLPALADAAGARVREVTRLETLADGVARAGVAAADFADVFRASVRSHADRSVGWKTIAAYRHGLDSRPFARPTPR